MIYFIGFKFSLLKLTLVIYWVTKKKIKIKIKLGIVSNMDQTINLNFGFLHVTVILWAGAIMLFTTVNYVKYSNIGLRPVGNMIKLLKV